MSGCQPACREPRGLGSRPPTEETGGSHHSHSSTKPVRGRRSSPTPPAVGLDSRSTREPSRGAGPSSPAGPRARAKPPTQPRPGPARRKTPGPGRTPPRPTAPSWERVPPPLPRRVSASQARSRRQDESGAEAPQRPGDPDGGSPGARLPAARPRTARRSEAPQLQPRRPLAASHWPARGGRPESPLPGRVSASPPRLRRSSSSAVAALEFRLLSPPPSVSSPRRRAPSRTKTQTLRSSEETTSAGSAT